MLVYFRDSNRGPADKTTPPLQSPLKIEREKERIYKIIICFQIITRVIFQQLKNYYDLVCLHIIVSQFRQLFLIMIKLFFLNL